MGDRSPEFESAIEGSPLDRGLRLIYSDWLQERGQEDYARAQRFMAENSLACLREWYEEWECPIWAFTSTENIFAQDDTYPKYRAAALPVDVFQSLAPVTPPGAPFWTGAVTMIAPCDTYVQDHWCAYRTPQLAVEYLAKALKLMGFENEALRSEVVSLRGIE
jgi:uncharacterized protein (TIGR02996 family)